MEKYSFSKEVKYLLLFLKKKEPKALKESTVKDYKKTKSKPTKAKGNEKDRI